MENLFSNNDVYRDLIIKVLTGNGSAEEVELLKNWLNESEENRQYFKEISHTWQVYSAMGKSTRFDSERAWEKAKPFIGVTNKPADNHRINYKFVLKIAAVWVLAFFLGGLAMFLGFKQHSAPSQSQASINEIVTPLGCKSQITLPDGTKVWLNAGSKLRYSQTYNTTHRDVYLEGEAYFKVTTNRKKPFVVITSDMKVKAYGTAFNVKAYAEEPTITTTLVEGIVKIEGSGAKSKKFEVSLKPQQKLIYTKENQSETVAVKAPDKTEHAVNTLVAPEKKENNLPIAIDSDVKTSLYTSWKDDKWFFERENLSDFMVTIERRYNVKIVYKSDGLKRFKVSGTIKKETLEQVLDLLKLTIPMVYEVKEGVVTLGLDEIRSKRYSKVMSGM